MKRFLLYLFRRIFIFADLRRPIIPWKINLLWYNKKVIGKYNVGDYLSVVVANYLLKRYKIKMFPHSTVRLSVIGSRLHCYDKNHVVSTLTNDWKKFIDKIVEAKLVISSSLHGIILAEAYGVPCIMLNDTETPDLFKYEDYYLSTGRKMVMAKNIDEALKMKNVEVPNLEIIQERLLAKFVSFK